MTEIEFALSGHIPSKKNSKRIIRNPRTKRPMLISSAAYLKWHRAAIMLLLAQKRAYETAPKKARIVFPLQKCARVSLALTFGDQRRQDLSNKAESVMDLLVDAGILADDNHQVTGPLTLTPRIEKGKAGANILLTLPPEAS